MCGYFYWLNNINALNTTDEPDQDKKPTSPNKMPFKVARNSFLARAVWAADCACSREHTRLTQCKSSDLVHSKILQNLYFDGKYL